MGCAVQALLILSLFMRKHAFVSAPILFLVTSLVLHFSRINITRPRWKEAALEDAKAGSREREKERKTILSTKDHCKEKHRKP